MNFNRLGIALVFATGCAVGGASARFVVPLASAQQATTLTKWEYSCLQKDNDDMTAFANQMGAQGWEITGAGETNGRNENLWCFKRPRL